MRSSRSWVGPALGCGCFLAFGIPAGMALAFYLDPAVKQPAGDRNEATATRPALSPSGSYYLVVLEGTDPSGLRFRQWEVMTAVHPQKVVFTAPAQYRTRDTVWFAWDHQDHVWVYSGDEGTTYWVREAAGEWTPRLPGPGAPSAPEVFRKRRPQVFR